MKLKFPLRQIHLFEAKWRYRCIYLVGCGIKYFYKKIVVRSNTDYNGKLVRNMLRNAKRETRISHLSFRQTLYEIWGKKKRTIYQRSAVPTCIHDIYIYIYIYTGCLPRKYNVNYNISDRSSYTVEFSISGLPNQSYTLNFFFFFGILLKFSNFMSHS